MPFKFIWFCELLEDLFRNKHHHATTRARSQNPDHYIIISWFNKYDSRISRAGHPAVALLSALFPERRIDRVYNLQEHRLSAIFGRALGLGSSRARELNRWRQSDGADFSICVQQVMAQCEIDEPPPDLEVSLEEVDEMLHQIAANSPFSSPNIRSERNSQGAEKLLTPILRRLQSREAKWLVRMLLKNYMDISIPEWFVLTQFHFTLPYLLSIQNSFEAAIEILQSTSMSTLPSRPDRQYEKALLNLVSRDVSPQIGTMVQRQPYLKARSIKHCCNLAEKREMSVERKYDGEYCQIHIDFSKGQKCIQIFSKSGKDSTEDRIGLHGVVKDCLRIEQDNCKIKERLIIEGELLVWSSDQKCILPFHKIRRHVQHGGRNMGTTCDSSVSSDEHLIIAFYDILLLDAETLLNQPLRVRRMHLEDIVKDIEGRGFLGDRQLINFSSHDATKRLRMAFSNAIAQRWEGFVLKACDEPYFSWQTAMHGIKLKKDYIAGLGDSADLCLIGGRREAKVELELGLGNLRWTSFHIGCVTNKDDVVRFNALPRFKLLDELTHHSIPSQELLDLNKFGQFRAAPYDSQSNHFIIERCGSSMREPTEIFKQPFVVEIMGAGFGKPPNCDFYTLRFPRKIDGKVRFHSDRSVKDSTSFQELQVMARDSLRPADDGESQEAERWAQMLLRADGKSQSTDESSNRTSPGLSLILTTRSPTTPTGRSKNAEKSIHVHADVEEDWQKSNLPSVGKKSANDISSSASPIYGRGTKRASDALRALQQPRVTKRSRTMGMSPWPVDNMLQEVENLSLGEDSVPHSRAVLNDENPAEETLLGSFVKESIDIAGDRDSITSSASHSSAGQAESLPTSPLSSSIKSRSPRPVATAATYDASGNIRLVLDSSNRALSDEVHGTHVDFNEQHLPNQTPVATNPGTPSQLLVPIYIAPSGSRSLSVQVISQLYNLLPKTNLAYTHILESFLDAVNGTHGADEQNLSKGYHLIFLDFNHPRSAKADLDDLFHNLVLRSQFCSRDSQGCQSISNKDIGKYVQSALERNRIMLWDLSLLHHLSRTGPLSQVSQEGRLNGNPAIQSAAQLVVTMSKLAALQHDAVGSELFGGFLHLHERTWIEKGKLRYYLVKNWDWAED